jgi:hypothetical protein
MSDSAREIKIGLNTKSGFRKFLHAREYHKVANGVYRHVKVAFHVDLSYHISYHFFQCVSDRVYDRFQFQPQSGISPETGRFRFLLTVYANLTLSVDQRISTEPLGPYTYAG